MKKILSVTLVLTLMLSMLSMVSFSADEYSSEDDIISGEYNYEFLEDGTIGINRYLGTADEVVIPSEIDGYKVTALHRYCFAGFKSLKSVTVPEGVTRIGFCAFEDCFNLEELILPDSLREMHFMYIDETKLYKTASNWENGVLYVGKHLIQAKPSYISGKFEVKEGTIAVTYRALEDCKDLTEVVLPDSLKYIGNSAFSGCKNLTKVNLSDNITFLDFAAFSNCPLEEVYISKNLKTLEPYVFRGAAITEVTIPDNIETIRYSAFQNCDGLTEITIPKSVKAIENGAFFSCENLCKITLPENLETVGDGILSDTAYANNEENYTNDMLYYKDILLKSKEGLSGTVNVKDGTRIIADGIFTSFGKINSVNIPDSVEIIGSGTFAGCENLKSVKLSKNLTKISVGLFSGCSGLESFTIPENVKEIGEHAFFNCKNLKYIVIPESVESFGENSVGFYNPYFGYDESVIPLEYSKVEDLVIAGYKGSKAESYAKEHGFTFEDLSAPTLNNKYKDKVLEILELSENEDNSPYLVNYQEVYEHSESEAQATPDYVLIKVYSNLYMEADCTKHFGDYVMYENSTSTPFAFGYGIYIPEENKLYSLEEAYDKSIENLNAVFEKGYIGKLTGDVNFDEKLNIRDATAIQKHIANIDSLYGYNYMPSLDKAYMDRIADFNKDGKITIRDVTAIQKRLAGVDINNPNYDNFEENAYESTIKHSKVTINDKTYDLRSDEVMSVEVILTCSNPISKLSFDLKYNGDGIKPLGKEKNEEYLKTHCPNISADSELRNEYGYIYVNATDSTYDFNEGKILFAMDYTVNHQFDSEFKFDLKNAFDKDGKQICYNSVATPDTDLTISYNVRIEKMPEK